MANDVYTSPLASRYASPYMLHLFSPDSRFQTWRRLWVALARAQHQLGLPITARQVQELEAHVTDIDYEVAAAREREVRHDVMAHVYAYGKAAPSAAGILHLGATSCYVTDNADLILYRDGLRYLRGQLLSVLADLAAFARRYAAVPTLGYTHYQPAQPVTVGKRATLWMQDFLSDVEELDCPALRPEISGLPWHHRHRGQLHGPLRRRRGEDRRDEPPHRRRVRLFGVLPRVRPDLPPQGGQPHPELPQLHRPECLSHGRTTSACCSTIASWRNPLRTARSAPPPWPTNATPCAANASAP